MGSKGTILGVITITSMVLYWISKGRVFLLVGILVSFGYVLIHAVPSRFVHLRTRNRITEYDDLNESWLVSSRHRMTLGWFTPVAWWSAGYIGTIFHQFTTNSTETTVHRGMVTFSYFIVAGLIISVGVLGVANPGIVSAQDETFAAQNSLGMHSQHFIEPEVTAEAVEANVAQLVNEEREIRGLSPLEYREDVSVVARAHSEDMVRHEYTGHQGSDGRLPADRINEAGIDCLVGENAAQTFHYRIIRTDDGRTIHTAADEVAEDLVNQWMNSPDHRSNILHEGYESHGVGVEFSDTGVVQATNKFCL